MAPLLGCSVCIDPETSENPIYKCISCGVQIHSLCYGIKILAEPSENWLCSPCKSGTSVIRCEFCPKIGGACKKTTCGKWIHVICALFTDGVRFEDNDLMEPVEISNVSHSKRNKKCAYCSIAEGVCPLCSKNKCDNRIHITCAQSENCLAEQVSKSDDTIKFRAYCLKHQPRKSRRRVSSGIVRKMVAKRGKKNQKKLPQSSDLNCEWILKASQMESELIDDCIVDESNKENVQTNQGSQKKQPSEKSSSRKKRSKTSENEKCVSSDKTVSCDQITESMETNIELNANDGNYYNIFQYLKI